MSNFMNVCLWASICIYLWMFVYGYMMLETCGEVGF